MLEMHQVSRLRESLFGKMPRPKAHKLKALDTLFQLDKVAQNHVFDNAPITSDMSPKFLPTLYGVLRTKSLALGRHLVHRFSLHFIGVRLPNSECGCASCNLAAILPWLRGPHPPPQGKFEPRLANRNAGMLSLQHLSKLIRTRFGLT